MWSNIKGSRKAEKMKPRKVKKMQEKAKSKIVGINSNMSVFT